MKRFFQILALLAAMSMATMTLAQNPGAPSGNTSPKGGTEGRSAGFSGGAGAAGQSGTDPATLKRAEEERVRKQSAHGASQPASAK